LSSRVAVAELAGRFEQRAAQILQRSEAVAGRRRCTAERAIGRRGAISGACTLDNVPCGRGRVVRNGMQLGSVFTFAQIRVGARRHRDGT
jgi:hypothetical protein